MTIYTRRGSEVTAVLAACGEHRVHQSEPMTLILVRIDYDDKRTVFTYKFRETLKATGGSQEIDAAIATAPKVQLTDHALKRAIDDAE